MDLIQLVILATWLMTCLYFIPYSIIYRDHRSLKFITIALIFQNILSLSASNTLPGTISRFIILYKEIILWGTVLYVYLKNKKIEKDIIPALLLVGIIVVYLFVGNASVYTKLICFRQLTTPIILILYGHSLKVSKEKKRSYMRFIVDLGIFQAMFGLVERFILGDGFWKRSHVENLFIAKGFSKWVVDSLPGNYYSYDLYHFLGISIRRLVGIMTDPLLTSHYLALAIVISLFVDVGKKSIWKYMGSFLMTIVCVLTLSKGALLIIGIAFVCRSWIHNKVIALGLMEMGVLGVVFIIKKNVFRTVEIHMQGLTSSLSGFNLIGGGLGTSGNLASLGGTSSTSGESFWGMIIGQTGYIGLVIFIWAIYRMTRSAIKKNRDMYSYAIITYIIAVMIEAMVSESAINFVGSGCGFILLGITLRSMSTDRDDRFFIEHDLCMEDEH